METLKPFHFYHSCAAWVGFACLMLPLIGGEVQTASSLADRESSRRSEAIDEARELLRKGDEAYTAGRYEEAVAAYSGARDLIPEAPVSAELRAAATDRYAQASVEHARVLSRKGDVAAAKAAVDKVLAPTIAPNNPGALNFRAKLDDPIQTNPALTAEHAQNVDAVRRTLYKAEGAYNLGKIDEAKSHYQAVLRIDPTNAAARRGLERVAVAKSGYSESAYDHTRAEMLSQVDASWELLPEIGNVDSTLIDPGAIGGEIEAVSVKNKLSRIIIPRLSLEQASLDEALDFLRIRASENDTLELDPAKKGVNFAVNLGAPDSPEATRVRSQRFDLQVTNVPLSQALKYITEATRTTFSTDDYAVVITPLGSSSTNMVIRSYRVPPDFITSLSSATAEAAPADNPFGDAPAAEGLLARRMGAQEALEKQGITFPQGASASYIPAASTLRVINTEANQDIISQIIEVITKVEPVVVMVRVTMMKAEQTNLHELGFDWFLEDLGFGGESWVPGADKLNLTGGTQGTGRGFDDVVAPITTNSLNPITAGNRSGDTAISGNSIDSLINNQSGRQASNSAPGIFGAYGTFDNAKIQMLMRGLDQKKGVDLMSQPSLVTRSGQSSSIAIVREFIYATEYEPPELPQQIGIGGGTPPVTPATPTAFEKKDVGVTLEVLPVVDAEKRFINVTLNPVFSDFDGFVNYGSPINSTVDGPFGTQTAEATENAILMPIFSKEAVSTTVDVADGSTIVVGGLMREALQNVEDQVPILGSIPVVGRLFQSKAKETKSTMIFFLVNVELMDPTGRRYRER
jgi:general secretion pathway protein D